MQEDNTQNNVSLDVKIEALLFFKGEPVAQKKIAELVGVTIDEIKLALVELEKKLANRGITLVKLGDEVEIRTSPYVADLIATITKEELTRDLGRAGLETLSIVLYKGPISRREIDYIRGVNSNFILRNLLIRGLIEKVQSETDARAFLYKPTFELLSYMGITKIEDLPEYENMRQEIDAVEVAGQNIENGEETTDKII